MAPAEQASGGWGSVRWPALGQPVRAELLGSIWARNASRPGSRLTLARCVTGRSLACARLAEASLLLLTLDQRLCHSWPGRGGGPSRQWVVAQGTGARRRSELPRGGLAPLGRQPRGFLANYCQGSALCPRCCLKLAGLPALNRRGAARSCTRPPRRRRRLPCCVPARATSPSPCSSSITATTWCCGYEHGGGRECGCR